MQLSYVEGRSWVNFPEWTGERVYMKEIYKNRPLPQHLARWQPTVDQMLTGVDIDGPCYLMIDQGVVGPDKPHRRPGVHIDGYWIPSLRAHGGGKHAGSWETDKGQWKNITLGSPEAIILASDVAAALGYSGKYDARGIGEGGAFQGDLSGLQQVPLGPNTVYAGNVGFLHESIPTYKEFKRTLVRLNVPNWSPELH